MKTTMWMQRKAEKRPKWRAWDEYVDNKGFWQSPRWQSADKAMSHNSLWRFYVRGVGNDESWREALATPNLSPYLATGEGIIFALFPQGKTNFLVIHYVYILALILWALYIC